MCVPRNVSMILGGCVPRAGLVGLWPLDTPGGGDWSPSGAQVCGLWLAPHLAGCVRPMLAGRLSSGEEPGWGAWSQPAWKESIPPAHSTVSASVSSSRSWKFKIVPWLLDL